MRKAIVVVALVVLLAGCTSSNNSAGSATAPGTSIDPVKADAVVKVVRDMMATEHLRAVLVRVTIDGQDLITQAFGESMTGVPATTDMHFRNGAVAISYMSTLLLQLVDEKKVSLDDKVSTWLPDIPHTDRVTLGQLAQMTSGYVDFVQEPAFIAATYAQPFKQWTPEEQLAFAVSKPLMYEPGTNSNYAHTNYVILGLALEKITGQDLTTALREKTLAPLGLDNTTDPGTAAITEPVLHAFSSERRQALQIPAGVPFYEESTYWNPSWTLARGAIQTTNLHDLSVTAAAINSGQLLSPESYAKMVSTELRGRTTAIAGCAACFDQNIAYTYGLGVVISGNWLLQDPLFSGESAVEAYLPSQKIAIAVAVTYQPEAFDPTTGAYSNVADKLWRQIAAQVAPSDPPPTK
ncbi:serine hydrolase domain-containing protein [Pseudonocardia yunnanensis]|uniref:Serine hydrolase domain-containing protein n=1 Tax=Pseudonocardia yunnanensis TaxID=58107 RepID=A0ABW4EUW4_9PSEU